MSWFPKKLEIELQIDIDEINDFEKMRGNNCELQPGEEPVPTAETNNFRGTRHG